MNSTKYEKGGFDMSAIVSAAREKRPDSFAGTQERQAHKERAPVAVSIETANHGDIVTTSDGINAIVVDHDVEMEKMKSNDVTGRRLMALVESPDLISDINGYVPDYGENAPEGYDPGVQYIEENPFEKKAMEMVKIKKGFSSLTYGLHGLVDADSEEGRLVTEAMDKIRSGEVVLPTPEEYEQQKEEAARKKKERSEQLKQQAKDGRKDKKPTPEPKHSAPQRNQPEEEDTEIHMAEMPENYIMKKGAIEEMSEMNQNSTPVTPRRPVAVANDTNQQNAAASKQEEHTVAKTVTQPEQTPEEAPAMVIDTPEEKEPVQKEPEGAEEKPARQPLNLAEMEEEMKEGGGMQDMENVPMEEGQDNPAGNVTIINVKEGESGNVIRQLPVDTFNKVITSRVIQVNEVELKDVPVATRRITDINDYKALSRIRPKKSASVTERALINSGFVVTLKNATSMEMSSIFMSFSESDLDWNKAYQFCFEHTIGTSIGKMSYNEYVAKVDPQDVETILDGIYEISEHDEISVQINCGTREGCGMPYDVKVKTNSLATPDRLPQKSIDRVKEIINASKRDVDEAKKVQENSPTMIAKYIQYGDRTIVVRTTTGHMMINRINEINRIAEQYNGAIAAIVLFIEKIIVTHQANENVAPDVYELVDLDVICEELQQVEDEELNMIKDMISEKLDSYETVQYTLKGPFVCPNCGHRDAEIACTIADLVFQKVQRALA